MAGKRYRHKRQPTFNIGGIIQFVDGYWPPLTEPPCEDSGLCAHVENNRHFGLLLFDVDANFTLKQREATGANASMIEKAEAMLARMNLGKPKKPSKPAPEAQPALPPGPKRKDFPTYSKVRILPKNKLLELAARLEIITPAFKKKTNKLMAAAIITKLDDME